MDNTIFATEEELQTLKGIVYLIINTINNKIYIGISKDSFSYRYKGIKTWSKRVENKHLKFSIIKYGQTNFRIIILDFNRTIEELSILETIYIKLFGTQHENYGYNIMPGGFKLTEDGLKHKCEKLSYTKEEFEKKAQKIHGNQFSYLKISTFEDGFRYITWICNFCGKEKIQLLRSHLEGRGCKDCSNKRKMNKYKLTPNQLNLAVKTKFGINYNINNFRKIFHTYQLDIFCKKCKIEKSISYLSIKNKKKPFCNCGKFNKN